MTSIVEEIERRISDERKVANNPVSESERAGAMHRIDALQGVLAFVKKRTFLDALVELARIEPLRERLARSPAWQELLEQSALAGIETGTAETVKQGSVPKG